MGLEEDAWDEYMADAASLSASCEQNKPPAGNSGAAGQSPLTIPSGTAAEGFPTPLYLGVEYIKMLIAEGDGCEAVLVLERLLRVAERRNPLHTGGESFSPDGAELHALLHVAPPESPCEAADMALPEHEEDKQILAYRKWCANRVAAGELSLIRRSLAMVVELRQAAEDAQLEGSSQGSVESDTDDGESDSPDLKRQKT
jgi:hypothetical protein